MLENMREAFEQWWKEYSVGLNQYDIGRDELEDAFSDGWKNGRMVICNDCHGTGLICVGHSGEDSDGNAPIYESCDSCGKNGRIPMSEDRVDWSAEFERMSFQFQNETLRSSCLFQELQTIRDRTGDITGMAGPLLENGWDEWPAKTGSAK